MRRRSFAGFSEQKVSGLSPGTFEGPLSATNEPACSSKSVTKEVRFDLIVTGSRELYDNFIERGWI